jgi:hypothetical protein
VNKLTKKTSSSPSQAPPVTKLEDKITRWLSALGKAAVRYRAPLIIGLSALAVVLAAYSVITWAKDSREERLVTKLYRLTQSPEARNEDPAHHLGEMDRLVRDAKGAGIERFVLKSLAHRLAEKAFAQSALGGEETEGAEDSKPEPAAHEEILKRIEEYAVLGKERFPHDEDMQAWSQALLSRLRGLKSQIAGKRTFTPVLSTPPAAGSEKPPEAPGARPATAPEAAPAEGDKPPTE